MILPHDFSRQAGVGAGELSSSIVPRAYRSSWLLESRIGDHVMVVYHAAGEHEGTPCEEVTALAMKVDADGEVTEVWFLANEQAAYDAFWSALP